MTENGSLAKGLIGIAFILLVVSAGCIDVATITRDVTVKDRILNGGFGSCPCSILTTENEAYDVAYTVNCAKLGPGSNVTITYEDFRTCEVEDVQVLP